MKKILKNGHLLIPVVCLNHSSVLGFGCRSAYTRQEILQNIKNGFLASVIRVVCLQPIEPVNAFPTSDDPSLSLNKMNSNSDLTAVHEAYVTLDKLLNNWEKATVDCTYADVPRELLEQKNKEQLLEKASTYALFDKTTAVVSCKKTNRIVRDYIGVTGKGPLVGINKRLLKKTITDELDPELMDAYYDQVEIISSSLAKASSLSYTAGIADFDAFNNFSRDEMNNLKDDDSNLVKAKEAILDAKVALNEILKIVSYTST